jgi:hypothetical protein
LMQDRSPPTRQNLLATHGRTIHWVIRYRFVWCPLRTMYAVPRKPTLGSTAIPPAMGQKWTHAPQQTAFLFDSIRSPRRRAMSFTNGSTLICINAVVRKHKRDVLATPQHVEIKRRVKCLKCEYAFWQQSPRLALDLAEPCLPRQCR